MQQMTGGQPVEVDYLGTIDRYSIEIELDDATVIVSLSQIEAVGLLVGLRTVIADAEKQREEWEERYAKERSRPKVRRLRVS